MHLITPLAAGFADAANGSVSILQRGTSTRVTYYEDFEGDSAVTPTANVDLDANGRLIAYVNTLVTCTVYDSTGSAVATFTAGGSASGTEVISQSFTGVDYESGASGASKPTTLASALDLWKTSTGTIDFKVLVDGTSVTLQTAFSTLLQSIYNVRSSAFGATGDGTTDDTAAIQAAITAANANGGGIVWFPKGTYRTTSALALSDKVSLWGTGAGSSVISVDHASNNGVTLAGSTTRVWQEIRGLQITYAQTSSGYPVYVASGSLLRIVGCDIGTSTQSVAGVVVVSSTTTILACSDSVIRMGGGAAATAVTVAGAKMAYFHRCRFIAPASAVYRALVYGQPVVIESCLFDFSSCTSTVVTLNAYEASAAALDAVITNSIVTADGGGSATTVGFGLGTPSASAFFHEDGNTISCDTAYTCTVSAANFGMRVWLGSRRNRVKDDTNNSSSYAVDTLNYGLVRVTSSYAGNVAVTGTMVPYGNEGIVIINNSNGSNRDFTPGSPFLIVSAKTINTTQSNVFRYYATAQYLASTNTNYLVNHWIA